MRDKCSSYLTPSWICPLLTPCTAGPPEMLNFSWTKVYPIIPKPELRGLGGQVSALYTSRYRQRNAVHHPMHHPFRRNPCPLKPPLNTKKGEEFPTQPVSGGLGWSLVVTNPGLLTGTLTLHTFGITWQWKSSPGGLPWGENVTHFNGASLVTSNWKIQRSVTCESPGGIFRKINSR